MEVEQDQQIFQSTIVSSYAYIVLQFDGFRKKDISDTKQIYGILVKTALIDFLGIFGSASISFDIIALYKMCCIVRIPKKWITPFLGSFVFLGQYQGTICRILCKGVYPSLCSASHKVRLLVQSNQDSL